MLDYLAALVKPVYNDFTWRGILSDDEDALVAEAAFNTVAHVLVTINVDHFRVLHGQVSFAVQTPDAFPKAWRR